MARENHCILQKVRGKVKSWKKFLREYSIFPSEVALKNKAHRSIESEN